MYVQRNIKAILRNITMCVLAVCTIFCATLPCVPWRSAQYFAQHYLVCPGGLHNILRNITMCVLAVCTIFCATLSKKRMIFEKKRLLNVKRVLSFSLHLLL
jgi:adenosine/AMP kinase